MATTMTFKATTETNTANPFLFDLNEQVIVPDFVQPLTLYAALKLAAELEAKREALTTLVETLEEERERNGKKVEFYDDMTNTDELFNTGVVAKTVDMGKTKFLQLLREYKVLMPRGNHKNLPYQKHIDAGRLDVKWIQVVNRYTGERQYTPVPLFTGKGIIWIKQFIEKNLHCV
jgi:phage antirepressor YoqD-like protein